MKENKVCHDDIQIKENKTSDEKIQKKGIRDTLYKNIDVSVESMDKFIIGAVGLLILSMVIGVITK